ncbi:hypothetical protein [Rhodanobacter koreensis]
MYMQTGAAITIDSVICKMLEETNYLQAARKFADRYHDVRPDAATQRQFEVLNQLMQSDPSGALSAAGKRQA